MPRRRRHGLRALSLFSGGGGFDLAFDRAGFDHVASFDVLDICGATLRRSRPKWRVVCGPAGDVSRVDWSSFAGAVDVIHGGPPCQPFSIAGRRNGGSDDRDMWPAFVSAVRGAQPAAFVAENVPGLLDPKFGRYVDEAILAPLASEYRVVQFQLLASDFGVPQVRKRVIFAGFRCRDAARAFRVPAPTHRDRDDLFFSREARHGCKSGTGAARHRLRLLRTDASVRFHGTPKIDQRLEQQGQPDRLGTASDLAERRAEEQKGGGDVPPGERPLQDVRAGLRPAAGVLRRLDVRGFRLSDTRSDWNSVCPPVGYAVAVSVAGALGRIATDAAA